MPNETQPPSLDRIQHEIDSLEQHPGCQQVRNGNSEYISSFQFSQKSHGLLPFILWLRYLPAAVGVGYSDTGSVHV